MTWVDLGRPALPLNPPRSALSAQLLLLLLPDKEHHCGDHRQQRHGGEQQQGDSSPVGVHPQRKKGRSSSQEIVAGRLFALHLIEIVKGGVCDLHQGYVGEEGLVNTVCRGLRRLLAIQICIDLWHHWSCLNGANRDRQRKVAQVAGC